MDAQDFAPYGLALYQFRFVSLEVYISVLEHTYIDDEQSCTIYHIDNFITFKITPT